MPTRAKTAHRRIAFVLIAFLALHFSTHLSALGGVAAHGAALGWARTLYRVTVAEIVLLLAFAAQIMLGLRLALARRGDGGGNRGWWGRAQIASGLYLAFFIVMHVNAALAARWTYGLDTNFYWPAGTLLLDPLRWGFVPYYFLAMTAVAVHLGAALHFRGYSRAARLANIAGLGLAVPVLLAFSGALFPVELPQEYLDYFSIYGARPT